jgi:hypothetical protein
MVRGKSFDHSKFVVGMKPGLRDWLSAVQKAFDVK